jgi:hypothetical protein
LVNRYGNASLVFWIIAFAVPAILACFYYYITWRWVFEKRRAGKFLPHVFL